MKVINLLGSRTSLESLAIEGDSPVCEIEQTFTMILSTAGHANPVGNREVHLPRLNTFDDR
jgi:hypothetical protein